MKLITEINESTEVITEANASGGKDYYIKGVFMQANLQNKNRRTYPSETLCREATRYNNEYISKNRAYGELNHPPTPTINLDRVSHMIKELYQDGDNWIGKAKLLETPCGNIAKQLIKEGASLGVSSRGVGSLKESGNGTIVQDDFILSTPADIVADPSAPAAYVQGIMEGKEWVYVNGSFMEKDITEARAAANAGARAKSLDYQLKLFEDFINKISKSV